MKWSTEKKVGAFFILGLIIVAALLEFTAGDDLFSKKYRIKTYFASAKGLRVGDPVKLAGMEVGKVSGMRVAEGKVEVEMKIREGTPVRADSIASIKLVSLLGS